MFIVPICNQSVLSSWHFRVFACIHSPFSALKVPEGFFSSFLSIHSLPFCLSSLVVITLKLACRNAGKTKCSWLKMCLSNLLSRLNNNHIQPTMQFNYSKVDVPQFMQQKTNRIAMSVMWNCVKHYNAIHLIQILVTQSIGGGGIFFWNRIMIGAVMQHNGRI